MARPLVVVNTHALRVRDPASEPVHRLLAAAWQPEVIRAPDAASAASAVSAQVAAGCPAIASFGGDGTVNTIINALAGRDVPVLIVPRGTANDLARELPAVDVGGMTSSELAFGKPIDLIDVNGMRFCGTGGVGIASDVVGHLATIRRGRWRRSVCGILGSSIYPLVAGKHVWSGDVRRVKRRISWLEPGATARREVFIEGYGCLIANQRKLARDLLVAPDAAHDDGVFELGILRVGSRAGLLGLLAALRAGRASSVLTIVRATEATIWSDEEEWLFGDGELLCRATRFEVSIRPKAFRAAVATAGA